MSHVLNDGRSDTLPPRSDSG